MHMELQRGEAWVYTKKQGRSHNALLTERVLRHTSVKRGSDDTDHFRDQRDVLSRCKPAIRFSAINGRPARADGVSIFPSTNSDGGSPRPTFRLSRSRARSSGVRRFLL